MTIKNAYLTHNRPGTKRKKTTAIAVHWVGNPGSSAMANRNYFNSTDRAVSSNYIVGLQGEVICCIPDEEVSWCTNQANSYTVSIETCHQDATGKFNSATYASLVELTAKLCKKYSLNPQKGGVIRHFDVTGKVCPKWFVPKAKGGTDTNSGTNWMKFLADVAAKMGTTYTKTETSGKKYRTDWKKGEAVQIADHAQLFANESTATPSSRLRGGTYYIYDGKICKNGRYRITTRADYCGKTPAGKYVTGYVSIDKMS